MLRYIFRLILPLAGLFVHGAGAAQIAVPHDLEGWRGWVLQDEEYRHCPFLASAPATARDAFRCAWPERLTLTLDASGGTFTQRWQVFAESWVHLPGSLEHWPRDVRVDGARGAIVAREGFPSLRLAPGAHSIEGRLAWSARPESMPVDIRTAIVDLTIDGRRITQPERPDGALWLGKRRSAEQPARMEVQVYRLLRDVVPAQLITRIHLQVSGDGREENLARVLPDGFTPLNLESLLPARLEPDGRLRVQVRAGSWEIVLAARGAGVAARLARPAAVQGLWAREEVWSFAGEERLRVAAAQGAEGIDPTQANVPADWRAYPAFRMAAGTILTLTERSRGLENADDNRLGLSRQLWLDFDHRGFTALDHIGGTMRKDWRLEMTAPYTLESARNGEDVLLVTRLPAAQGAGLEVRSPDLRLEALARAPGVRSAMPATGWNTRFEQVTGQLNLPPGHRLLAVIGADSAPGAWIERWGLWGVFGVLVVAVFAGWLAGWPIGVIAFVALLLTYQESPGYIWLWSNLLAALALARAAPDGLLRRVARAYRTVSFIVLGIALLPLLGNQVRVALHPQLGAETAYAGSAGARNSRLLGGLAPVAPMSAVAVPAPEVTVDEAKAVTGTTANAAPRSLEEGMVTAAERSDVERRSESLGSSAGGLNYAQVVQRYAPGTLLQTGPGVPAWSYAVYAYGWSGPVDAQQSVRFVFVGPLLLGLWRFTGAILLGVLFLALLPADGGNRWRWPDARNRFAVWFGGRSRSAGGLASAGVFIVLMGAFAPHANAASTPDATLLNELKSRLSRAPDCMPSCADLAAAQVMVRGDRLDLALEVSALATIAVAMPSAGDRWQIDSVTVDDRPALAIGRESDGTLWIPITPGAHAVRLSGQLASAESIQLAFPSPPRSVSVKTDGWDASGVNEGRLLSGSLELVRHRTSAQGAEVLESSSEFPAFVRVLRTFDLGLDWSLTSAVVRIAPAKAAMSVEVPLITGESVLTEGLEVHEKPDGSRNVWIGLERGQQQSQWTSGLPRGEVLELALPSDSARAEEWRFVVSPQWNVAFEGLPAVLPADISQPVWVYEFHPRPGEKLRLHITRPPRAAGSTLAIDSVEQRVSFGKRSATTALTFRYRSTQGARHSLTLPKSARVTGVQFDGQPVQIRPVDGELSLGLVPGTHSVGVQWTIPTGASLRTQPPAVDLHSKASNVLTTLDLPQGRWPLLAIGGGVGPAVLYWSELVVFLILAWLLGRWKRSPLATHEWLLLGLGLSTLSWGVFALVALWLFACDWRQRWTGSLAPWRFNSVQVLLAILTVVAVGTLVFSGIRQSLLASPDMGIAGPGSGANVFGWFVDQTASTLPRPWVISAPMWVYRALMFAWALWLVLALLRWLRWAWAAWKANGIWRGKVVVA